ncbi:acyltransferase family protein [Caballeronia ptereochthonis]|uniref:Acyltransferase n=1 Tax=Caballeronia ptereochthonis TaxID=1777144 RepID=A0A158B691_9BURK|nr:acyltransferase [Caballeronia ptereochthonis]SAK65519.1 acyltransferase [Caballeronia ptereochthonis]
MKNHVQELTGLRCVAVTMVVIGHAQHMIDGGYSGLLAPLRLISDGRLGVLIFFVLSGYLITSILNAEWKASGSIRLLPFYAKRALRIWPAFYMYLAIVAFMSFAGLVDIDHRQVAVAALHLWNYSAIAGMGSLNAAHADGAWYLGHFWTLALEEQFYWFWPPLLFHILKRGNQRALVALIVLVPLVRIATYFAAPSLRGQLSMMLHTGIDPILIGCFVALNKDGLKARVAALPWGPVIPTATVLLLLFAVSALQAKLGGLWRATYGTTIESAMVGFVIVVLISQKDFWFSRLLRTAPFVYVGTISFSLYLWQQLFSNVHSPVAYRFPLCVVGALAAATLSYYLIEAPFLRIKDRFATRSRLVADTSMRAGVSK